jgi:hypothetical protein
VVQVALEEQPKKKRYQERKLAVRIKGKSNDVFIYNGASQYLVQAVLKELMNDVS